MERTSFLTANEKRAAIGYDPLDEPPPTDTPPEPTGPFDLAPQVPAPFEPTQKYSPNQPRVSAGHEDGGQWTDGARAMIQSTSE